VERAAWLLAACLAALPLLGGLVLLYRRFYRDDGNQARRIVKNSALPLLLRLLVRGLDLLVALIVLSVVAPELLGAYSLAALFIVQYLGTVSEFGLGLLLTREAAKAPLAAPRLFGLTLTLRLLLTAACVPAAALLIGVYALLGALGVGAALSPLGQQAIWILLLTLPASAYAGAVSALYMAAERMETPALVELITAILSTVARVAVVLLGFGVLGLAWAAVGVSLLAAAIFYLLQRREFFAPRLAWDGPALWGLARTAFPLMLNGLLLAVFFRFDTFLIRAFGGSDLAVQQYMMPYQVIGIAMILPPALVGAVFPMLARQAGDAANRAGLQRAQLGTLRVLLLLAMPLATAMTLLAPELVRFFTRANADAYLPESAHVLAVTAWFLPLSFVNGLNQYVLIALDRQRSITLAFGIAAAFNFGLNLLAVPLLGLLGASAVTILTECVLYLVFRRALRPEALAPGLLPLAWRPALAALVLAAALLPLKAFGLAAGPALLLAVPLGALAYGAALWALGVLGAEERALVRRVIGG
jgi:O-antigen/teichoic acid export membrane protein